MMQVYDRVLPSRSGSTLTALLGLAILCLIVSSLLDIACSRILAAIAGEFESDMSGALTEQVIRLTASGEADPAMASLKDLQQVSQFISGPAIKAIVDLPWFPVFLAIIWMLSPALSMLAAAGAVLLVLLALLGKSSLQASMPAANEGVRRAGQLHDNLKRNAEAMQGLGMTRRVVELWKSLAEAAMAKQLEVSATSTWFSAATKFSRYALQVLMLAFGAWLVIGTNASPGIMIACTIILARFLAPIEQIVTLWRSIADSRVAWLRLVRTIGKRKERPRMQLPPPSGKIDVEGVAYSLTDDGRQILHGVNFSLPPGASLAIVGPSGAGKTTLARLLSGIIRPTAGNLRLDGAAYEDWDEAQRHGAIGYLPQAVELLPGTVAQNIARFTGATGDVVVAAARAAHCHELILSLPNGYDTEIGDSGERLSPGQRQRIGLARALFGGVKVVVLDEPNANLDADGELALQRSLRDLTARGVTWILISHRFGIITMSKNILVLRPGAPPEFGLTARFVGSRMQAESPAPAAVGDSA